MDFSALFTAPVKELPNGTKYCQLGEGKPLIFIPDTLGDHRMFAMFDGHLPRYQLITFDHPRVYTLEEALDILINCIDQLLGTEQRFIIGGSSVGGYFAQHYTSRFPERVEALIMGNTFHDNNILQLVGSVGETLVDFIPDWVFMKILHEGAMASLKLIDTADEVRDYYAELFEQFGKEVIKKRWRWSTGDHEPPVVQKEIPKLIIYSQDDTVLPLPISRAIVKQYPEAKVKKMGIDLSGLTGHIPYYSKPEEYVKALKDFLKDLEDGKTSFEDQKKDYFFGTKWF